MLFFGCTFLNIVQRHLNKQGMLIKGNFFFPTVTDTLIPTEACVVVRFTFYYCHPRFSFRFACSNSKPTNITINKQENKQFFERLEALTAMLPRFQSSGMLRPDWQLMSHVSKGLSAFIFRVRQNKWFLKLTALRSFVTPLTCFPLGVTKRPRRFEFQAMLW
jgi:hypothetical protein